MSGVIPSSFPDEALPALIHCEERIGYTFTNRGLLYAALTHASGASHRLSSNERLEFLGDAILGAVVSEALFYQYPDYLEGDLTKIKSVVVSRRTCSKMSKGLELQEFLILGKGMSSHPSVPPSLLADVFESLIAAIFLDSGVDAAKGFILRHVAGEIEHAVEEGVGGNYKSLLQQQVQRELATTPTYVMVEEKGPDHNKQFKMCARVHDRRFTPAWGRSKKDAEQRAARNALAELNDKPLPYPAE